MIFSMMLLNKQCNEKWQKLWLFKEVCTKRGASITRKMMARRTRWTRREAHWWNQHRKWLQLHEVSYMEITWCKFMQARASFEVPSRQQVEQRRGGKAERRKLLIICHATDIVCSFHCQIMDCYDLNEWFTIVRYNRFSSTDGYREKSSERIIFCVSSSDSYR